MGMKVKALVVCSFLVSCLGTLPTARCQHPANARNPIIWADVPDLAIIRVSDVYYMSSTTMHMSPGLPIMKSSDLVNWRLVGYAYDTLADNDDLTLKTARNAYGAGSWASSLRHHNGVFYATTFSRTTGRTHVYTTDDIENGPWTEISFRPFAARPFARLRGRRPRVHDSRRRRRPADRAQRRSVGS